MVVKLAGPLALAPIPRLAKAVHSSRWPAPPVLIRSAWMMASRASRNVGLAGVRFRASVTSCRII